ncbi:MAG: hypothetical protein HYZ54_07235 [Ignavibacteriae bacterium]|nr:hypothetical protein [Ignavibacteriota bacterium]
MVKITKTPTKKGGYQYKVTIPTEIATLKNWDENTEILFVPFVQDPKTELDKDSPIVLKEIRKDG